MAAFLIIVGVELQGMEVMKWDSLFFISTFA